VRRSATTTVVLMVVAAIGVAGCTISADNSPRDISPEAQRPLEPESDTASDAAGSSRVFFVVDPAQEGRRASLSSVARDVPNAPEEALNALLSGPTQAELERGYSDALPSGLDLTAPTRLFGGTLTVDVSEELDELAGEEEIMAVAQIVATVSEVDGVERVRLRTDGTSQPWPDSRGLPVTAPLTVFDYTDLLASAQPPYPAVPSA
jgi:spore germination protein GerM